MEDFRLKVFHTVASHGSLTKASYDLHISQPVISKYIKELEQEYEVSLFNRTASGVELTPAGELMLTHVENILRNYRKMDFDMHTMSHAHSRELRLGATATIAQYLLPAFMATFASKFKQIKLSLIEGSNEEIEHAVEEKCVDIGLLECYRRKPQFRYTPFGHDEYVLVAARQGEWSKIEHVSIKQLYTIPLVVTRSEYQFMQSEEINGLGGGIPLSQLNIIQQMDSIESIKRYISHTSCAALLPLQAVVAEIKMGVLKVIEIDNLSLSREYAIIRNLEETTDIVKDFIFYVQHDM